MKKNKERSLVKQQKTEQLLDYLGKVIQDVLNKFFPGWGFTLVIFKFNEKGVSSYVTSAERETMIKSLKEMVEQLEKNQDFPTSGPSGLVH
ncbi:hypothetical protein KAW18_01160 [candidate division WOR-3 bacterium]|nr:hypothetical protein [candidate division WOR-3 bacterium]